MTNDRSQQAPAIGARLSAATKARGADLCAALRSIVGRRHVLTSAADKRRFCAGFRTGEGDCRAVVRPGSLVDLWRTLQACVAADCAIILQAANTGLTGGSTPNGSGYDRDVVVINTMRLDKIVPIAGGKQVICYPGATLYQLERTLRPYGREPHSVIGSSCLGASVIGGVCNNSGGALVRRGPAFTQLAIYARETGHGELELVDNLGLGLEGSPEQILQALDRGEIAEHRIAHSQGRWASDAHYIEHVRKVDEPTPARFNADTSRLFEASGSAGKLAVFAVRLDTFARDTDTRTFFVGTNDPVQLTNLRRTFLLDGPSLPIAGEYLHRDAFDIASIYGKDMYRAIQMLGTDRLPTLFRWKARFDNSGLMAKLFGRNPSDRMMQRLSTLLPPHLPARIADFRMRFEHLLIIKMADQGIDFAHSTLNALFAGGDGDFFVCTSPEADAAFLHRFVTAGAAVRYRAVHSAAVEDIVALDIALPRNERAWVERLPADMEEQVIHKLYYGHFFCHVFHQDYILKKGADPLSFEHRMWALLDGRRAEYPAEHNVGHLYKAKPELADFYRQLDPTNRFNPGIGQTSKLRDWASPED
ncbi:MAG: D-lactate dehydrogenase [Sphingomonadales bacterium]|nr:D-lactate dehydrogenase [Sphingomonadales bacterium]